MQAVALALACLSYDFVGTSMDDSSEDLGTIQVSTSLGALLVLLPSLLLLPQAIINERLCHIGAFAVAASD